MISHCALLLDDPSLLTGPGQAKRFGNHEERRSSYRRGKEAGARSLVCRSRLCLGFDWSGLAEGRARSEQWWVSGRAEKWRASGGHNRKSDASVSTRQEFFDSCRPRRGARGRSRCGHGRVAKAKLLASANWCDRLRIQLYQWQQPDVFERGCERQLSLNQMARWRQRRFFFQRPIGRFQFEPDGNPNTRRVFSESVFLPRRFGRFPAQLSAGSFSPYNARGRIWAL
jgi:hypothetical protein